MSVIWVNWHETQKCPIGGLAIVRGLGVCEVLDTHSWRRRVVSISTGRTAPEGRWVDVREIRQANGSEAYLSDCEVIQSD